MAAEPTHPPISTNTQCGGSEHADIKALMAKLCEAMLLPANAPKFDPLTVAQVRSVAHLAAFLAIKFVREQSLTPSTDQTELSLRKYQDACDQAFQQGWAGVGSQPILPDFTRPGDDKAEAVVKLAKSYRNLTQTLDAEKSTALALRNQINEIITTSRSLEEKVYALSIERAGLQARLRAQEDPSDEKVINEATTRFLAILNEKGTWPGSIQDRVGVAYRDVLGILREAAMAKMPSTTTTAPPIAHPHPPISGSAQIGGVQVAPDGSYRWWWSEMCTVNVRAQTATDFQGIPSWALRQIADHMDGVAKPAAPVEPSPSSYRWSISDESIEDILLGVLVRTKGHAGAPRWLEEQVVSPAIPLHRVAAAINRMLFRGDIVGGGGVYTLAGEKLAAAKAMVEVLAPSPTAIAEGEQNDRVLAQRTRILAVADSLPYSHNDLWRRAGSPQSDDAAAFDTALLQLADEGKLKVEDINGSKGYRLP